MVNIFMAFVLQGPLHYPPDIQCIRWKYVDFVDFKVVCVEWKDNRKENARRKSGQKKNVK